MTDRNKRKGFTLAELLVVVAIIAVLVAIAIPIFSSQLEKSREATDAANIRSQYAQVMTDAITEGGSVNGKTAYGAIELKQKKDSWQDESLKTQLEGIFQKVEGDYPKANGTAWVEYNDSDSEVILHYEGNGSNTGDSTEDNNSGNNGSSGEDNTSSNISQKLNSSAKEFKINESNSVVTGEVYVYKGIYYISLSTGTLNSGGTPEPGSWYEHNFVKPTDTTYTYNDVNSNGNLVNVKYGDIYVSSNGSMYISKCDSSVLNTPDSGNEWDWIKILIS